MAGSPRRKGVALQTARRTLDSLWQSRELGSRGGWASSDLRWLPARVSGPVHLDLWRAGAAPDPFARMQERTCAWVGEADREYETTFHLDQPAPPRTLLEYEGLDNVAEASLNGEEIGRADDMLVPHEFEVGPRLRAGEGTSGDNTLRVVFRSALRVGRERQRAWSESGRPDMPPHWFVWGPRSFVRKAQYMYGWDRGPELASCGISRPVRLITVPVARLLDWQCDVELAEDGAAVLHLTAWAERAPGAAGMPLMLTAPTRSHRATAPSASRPSGQTMTRCAPWSAPRAGPG